MNFWLILVIVILSLFLILLAPISISYKMYISVLENKGFVLVKVAGIKAFATQLEVMGGDLILTNPNGKMQKIKIKKPSSFQNAFIFNLVKELDLTKLIVYFGCGIKNDAFLTSMSCGIVEALFCAGGKILKDKNNAFIFYQIEPNYNKDDLWIALDGTIMVCILAVLFVLIKSIFTNKGVKNERRKFAK